MFVHNIDPVLLSIGPLEIRYYGLVYVLGFILIYFFLKHFIKKGYLQFNEEKLDMLMIYSGVGMLLGARIFTYLFWHPEVLVANPLRLFAIWEGGMSFHGGLFGAAIGGLLFSKKYKVGFYKFADLMVIPAGLLLFLGRIANFINGELPGTRSDVSWCVVFPNFEGCRHPYQIYEGLKNLGLSIILFVTFLSNRFREGVLFWSFILLYSSFRFFIDFLRDEPSVLLGISMGQWLSVVFFAVSVYYLLKVYNKL